MARATRSFVGRERELQELRAAIDEARAGRGGLWFITGEPGIGKSRLLEEAARTAADRDVHVLWGRCWEAGGAPAFWPFIQALRALLRIGGELAHSLQPYGFELAELLPELREGEHARGSTPLPPEQARFRLLDTVSRALCDAAARAPLLLLLEDLHAADPSSLVLLDFLSQALRAAPLLVVGSYREADAQRSAVGPALARLSGAHPCIALPRLGAGEVAQYLEQAFGGAPERALCDAVFATTEGNPLFVGELARLHARGDGSARGIALPSGIRAAIKSRLQFLSAETRELLGMVAVVGRECRSALLASLAERPAAAIARALDPAIEAEVLLETAPGQLRFSHILLQQVLYGELEPARRSALHVRVAEQLLRDHSDPAGSERAHHLLAAGPEHVAEAVAAARAAARAAAEQHALAEAAAWYQRALDALPEASATRVERCELLLELGRARIVAHEFEAGRATCNEAAALARTLGDAERFARAALALGAVYVIADVDAGLIAVLREALAMLGEREQPLRARVMARLAAAQQPAPEVDVPIALAHEAVALARRIGDRPTLLATVDAAVSTMMDLSDPAGIRPLIAEQVALAQELGSKSDEFRALVRQSVNAFELGDFAGAEHAVRSCEQLAAELAQPHYRWRAHAVQASRALWHGEFASALQHMQQARELGARASDPNAERVYRFQRCAWLRMRGQREALRAAIEELYLIAPQGMGAGGVALHKAGELAWLGVPEAELRELLERGGPFMSVAHHDITMSASLAQLAYALRDRPLLELAYERAAPRAGHLTSAGVFGLTWGPPVDRTLGLAAAGLGWHERADQHYADALAQLRGHGGRPMRAWVAYEHGVQLAQRGEHALAAERFAEAEAIAGELEIELPARPSLVAPLPVSAGTAVPAGRPGSADGTVVPGWSVRPRAASLPEVGSLRLQREGDYWTVSCDGRSFRLKDGKGVAMLARLIEEAGRELHVLDLISPEGPVDRGDSGELLDARARAAYRARVEALQDELEEAERWTDHGRAERARNELETISEQLAGAVGVGGRNRVAGAAVERARVNVQRRLRDTLARIAMHDPELGRHLEWALKTGTYCSYLLKG